MEDTTTLGADPVVEAGTGRTVTFLFTDIEGSTTLLQELGDDRYRELLVHHDLLLRTAIEGYGGAVFGSAGDAQFGAFPSAAAGVQAAVAAQRALAAHDWPEGRSVRVRMAVHTGEAVRTPDGDYAGLELHRVARILSTGWGCQILVSQATRELVADTLDGIAFEDLGDHRLKDLTAPERLHQVVTNDLESRFPALRSLDSTPNNLPTQLTSFLGRERQLAELASLLASTRLLTLTGPGGTGKTRLSLRLAFDTADRFPGGIYFVPLETVTEPELVASEILSEIGLPASGNRPPIERLRDHFASRASLLVLDNFEQVLGAAPLVRDLLAAAPDLRVVVTSRAPLRVSGEQEYPVPPLDLPDPGQLDPERVARAESVALFVERAAAVRPGFHVDEDNAAAIAEIAEALDGLPLALELAAARVKLLTPQAIAERLSSRLQLLAGGSRDLPTRQQTLRDAIAWSYDLLDDRARRLLARLSVFAGGATLEAAEAVCGPGLDADVLDGLGLLVDQSLVRQLSADGDLRFGMLETIREYAAEQLEASGEAADVHGRHAEVFLALVEEAAPHLTGTHQVMWLDRLEGEHDNLRAALAWAERVGRSDVALRVLAAIWRLWQIRGHLLEGRMRAEAILAMPGVDDHPLELARALDAAGSIAYWQGDMPACRDLYLRSLERFEELGDPHAVAYAHYNIAFSYAMDAPPQAEPALEHLETSAEGFRGLDDPLALARVLWMRGNLRYFLRDFEEARRSFAESNATFRELEQPFDLGWGLRMNALVDLRSGDLERAEEGLREAVAIFQKASDRSALVMLIDDFRILAQERGEHERAVRLFGAAQRWMETLGAGLTEAERHYDRREDPREDAVDDHARLYDEGACWSLDDALDYALDGG